MFSVHANHSETYEHIRVTFSSRISNCFSTEPRRRCECSSTTRIFHLPGGFTERIASRNSAAETIQPVRERTSKPRWDGAVSRQDLQEHTGSATHWL